MRHKVWMSVGVVCSVLSMSAMEVEAESPLATNEQIEEVTTQYADIELDPNGQESLCSYLFKEIANSNLEMVKTLLEAMGNQGISFDTESFLEHAQNTYETHRGEIYPYGKVCTIPERAHNIKTLISEKAHMDTMHAFGKYVNE